MKDIIKEISAWIGRQNKGHTGLCNGCPAYPKCIELSSCDQAISEILHKNASLRDLEFSESGAVHQRSAKAI